MMTYIRDYMALEFHSFYNGSKPESDLLDGLGQKLDHPREPSDLIIWLAPSLYRKNQPLQSKFSVKKIKEKLFNIKQGDVQKVACQRHNETTPAQ